MIVNTFSIETPGQIQGVYPALNFEREGHRDKKSDYPKVDNVIKLIIGSDGKIRKVRMYENKNTNTSEFSTMYPSSTAMIISDSINDDVHYDEGNDSTDSTEKELLQC